MADKEEKTKPVKDKDLLLAGHEKIKSELSAEILPLYDKNPILAILAEIMIRTK